MPDAIDRDLQAGLDTLYTIQVNSCINNYCNYRPSYTQLMMWPFTHASAVGYRGQRRSEPRKKSSRGVQGRPFHGNEIHHDEKARADLRRECLVEIK
jgi:hypothetical protein